MNEDSTRTFPIDAKLDVVVYQNRSRHFTFLVLKFGPTGYDCNPNFVPPVRMILVR